MFPFDMRKDLDVFIPISRILEQYVMNLRFRYRNVCGFVSSFSPQHLPVVCPLFPVSPFSVLCLQSPVSYLTYSVPCLTSSVSYPFLPVSFPLSLVSLPLSIYHVLCPHLASFVPCHPSSVPYLPSSAPYHPSSFPCLPSSVLRHLYFIHKPL
jgi:hypothetical protein